MYFRYRNEHNNIKDKFISSFRINNRENTMMYRISISLITISQSMYFFFTIESEVLLLISVPFCSFGAVHSVVAWPSACQGEICC